MKDIPLFTTENGIASLILREIPTAQTAYVHIRSSETPEMLIKGCMDFCRAAGAEKIYATGHPCLTQYPRYTTLLHMKGTVSAVGETSLSLFPVTEKTWPDFCRMYNEKMAAVPTANKLRLLDREKYEKSAYFVHKNGVLYGIGIAENDEILAIASCQKGAGREVLAALCQVLTGEVVRLQVAENNLPAMRLYEKCGFLPIGEGAAWYKIF
ncbi:MAG: GNAT family N-acetyltransferase [Oscillospiraceae bacterium]|nr:GNAT family N-acetyltransferase [Oscillospiraceae bacterium]